MPSRQVTVTLARAWHPGDTEEDGAVIAFSAVVDAQGLPDGEAWLADPAPWPARFTRAGAEPEEGDVLFDEESWALRFARDAEAPVWRLRNIAPGFRPGEMLTLQDPRGTESAWRVVGLG